MDSFSLAYLIDWGWLRIGPPYIYLNIDPVIFKIGPLAVRWYGLMYVVAIIMGLQIIKGYTTRKGIDQDMVYRILWWCIGAGLVGGRLYFVIQQPDLVAHYIMQPWRILATWEGGMAFFGAVFLGIAILFWRARREHVNPFVLVDAGVLFAAGAQMFGRIGNIINGDIIGFPSTLPWSTVYQHPNSWACLNPATCNVPVQPAAAYEILTNLVTLAIILYLARRLTRPGILGLVYLFCYAVTQFFLFFVRANDVVSFFGLFGNWGLKQAQWTSLVLLVLLLPISYWVLRSPFSRPIPSGEVAATYGIPQKAKPEAVAEPKVLDGEEVKVEDGEIKHVEGDHVESTPIEESAPAPPEDKPSETPQEA